MEEYKETEERVVVKEEEEVDDKKEGNEAKFKKCEQEEGGLEDITLQKPPKIKKKHVDVAIL